MAEIARQNWSEEEWPGMTTVLSKAEHDLKDAEALPEMTPKEWYRWAAEGLD